MGWLGRGAQEAAVILKDGGHSAESWGKVGKLVGHGCEKAGGSGACLRGLEVTPGLISVGRPGPRTGVVCGAVGGAGVTALLALCLIFV